MVKIISTARRKPGLSVNDFQRKMREEHAPLIARMPALSGYVVNFAVDADSAPWDVVVEVSFADLASFHAALASPAGQAALTHMRDLVDMASIQSGPFVAA